MTRYLKALGLAMMAAFAFSALSAAGASAQEGQLTSESTEVTLIGKEDPAGTNAFTAFGAEVKCPEAVYTGHATLTEKETEEGKTHQPLHSGETEVTVTPHYNEGEGCEGGNGSSRTIDMNGCDFRFYDFTAEAENTYDFDIDIVCPEVDEVKQEITITEGICTVHVPEQNNLGLTGLHATNEGGKIRLHGEVTGITARLPCIGDHTENAVQHQDVLVEGIDPATEEATGISISD